MSFTTTLLLLTLATLSLCDNGAPQYTECQSNAQCGPDKCCAIVKGRFDTTACLPYQRMSDNCRPASDTPISTTLSFPGGVSTKVTAHENICPCETGAACSRGFCVKI